MSDLVVFDDIFEAIRALEPANPVLRCKTDGGVMTRHQRFDLVQMEDGRIGGFAMTPNFGTYYRGENALYPSCMANYFRIADREERMVHGIKTCDFVLFLKNDPKLKVLEEQSAVVDYKALAQHYEFPTDMLDVTSDIIVAAFFAVTRFDRRIGRFMPLADGMGRIRYFTDCYLGLPGSRIRMFGMQEYCRPGFQNGYGLVMAEEEDFSEMSYSVEFRQNAKINELFFHSFPGQEMFFPQEPLQDIAALIKQQPISTNAGVELYCASTGENLEEVKDIVKGKGIELVDAPLFDPRLLPKPIYRNEGARRQGGTLPLAVLG